MTRQQPTIGGAGAAPEESGSGPNEAAHSIAAPLSIRAAATIQAIEAVGVLAASLIAGVDALSGKSYHRASGVAITLIGIATAAALAYVARGVQTGRRWSRTPAMLTQLFTGIVAVYLIQAPRLDWGIPAIALAIGGFGALLAPASLRTLTPGRPEKT